MNTTSAPVALVYIGDPMCSWCYGFGVPLGQLLASHPDLPVQLVLGGLRAYNTQVMDDALKAKLRGAWANVAQRSGQRFSHALLEREDFIYDTEPACRAVVTMRLLNPPLALAYKARVQHAFYAEGRDTTRDGVLADIAAEAGVEREMFFAELVSEEARRETQRDFQAAGKAGIHGFPTLLAGDGTGHYLVVTNGYRPLDGLPQALERWLDG